ncbi:hypothetical protein N9J36_02835 [Litoricola sp.]|nr:hypothetical protein [Litorivicinus sp.]
MLAPYLFVSIYFQRDVSILPVMILVVFSFLSLSRSGILSSLIILFAVIYYRFGLSRTIFLLGLSLTPIVFYLVSEFSSLKLIDQMRFLNFFSDGGRESINDSFIRNFAAKNIIIPFDFSILFKETGYLNFHNSFIYFFGYDFVYAAVFCAVLIAFFVGPYSPALKLVVLACIVRVSTDAGALFGFFDLVFYFPLFLFFKRILGFLYDSNTSSY